jgi:hypothetical protein
VHLGREARELEGKEATESMALLRLCGLSLTLVAFIQSLIPLGLRAFAAACEYEVRQLAGLGLPPRSEAPGPGPAGGTSRSPSPRTPPSRRPRRRIPASSARPTAG